MRAWWWTWVVVGLSSCRPDQPVDLDELADLSASCAGPEGTVDCAPGRFEAQFSERLDALKSHREAVVARWLEALARGHHEAAYGLAWAGEGRAVPLLRQRLLAERYFYGWETNEPFALETRMSDENYPRHVAYRLALGVLLPKAQRLELTTAERAELVAAAFEAGEPGGPPDAARWLLLQLTPDVFTPRPSSALPRRALAVPRSLEGYLVAAHASDHHDVFLLARAHAGVLQAVGGNEGCRVLRGATVQLGTPPVPVRLPKTLFSNEVQRCLSDVRGLPPGDAVGALRLELEGHVTPVEPARRRLYDGLALEALFRDTGADPADFVGDTAAVRLTHRGRAWVVVTARAILRAHEDGEVPCASSLCGWGRPRGPSASVVVVFEDAPVPVERLRVPSHPGGCVEGAHDEVALSGVAMVEGLEPLVVVQRRACDGWTVGLYGLGPGGGQLIAERDGGGV